MSESEFAGSPVKFARCLPTNFARAVNRRSPKGPFPKERPRSTLARFSAAPTRGGSSSAGGIVRSFLASCTAAVKFSHTRKAIWIISRESYIMVIEVRRSPFCGGFDDDLWFLIGW